MKVYFAVEMDSRGPGPIGIYASLEDAQVDCFKIEGAQYMGWKETNAGGQQAWVAFHPLTDDRFAYIIEHEVGQPFDIVRDKLRQV